MARSDGGAFVSVERFFQFAVLGLVASGFLAVAGSGYLDLSTVIFTSAGLVLRALMIWGVVRLDISERAVTAVAVAYAGFLVADYFLLSRDLLACTVHLVFFLAVMKTLTAKSNRDYLSLSVIALLELLAAALLSIDFRFVLSLVLFLVFAVATLTSAEIRRSAQRSRLTARSRLKRFHFRLGGLAVFVATAILAVTAALFFTLPRTADAAFSRFARRSFVSGFANEVTLGQIGRIKAASQPVMHIRVFGNEPTAGVKWRGASLSDFDGRRWTNYSSRKDRVRLEDGRADLSDHPYSRGRRLNYTVIFDALDANALFFAGIPERIELNYPRLFRSEDGDYSLDSEPPRGFYYEAYGLLDEPPEVAPPVYPAPILRLEARARYLQLPSRQDSRIPALAREMAGGAEGDLARARSIEDRLRSDYGYTLQLPSEEPADPLAYFLFDRKAGHCEYFASAMAVMLRDLGIPARLATGFQSGEYNPMTGLWIIRASDAHSWVEAWIPGYGWVTFDPTPPDPKAVSFSLLSSLDLYFDAAQTFWQEWVVGYDMGRQGVLAGRMERGARRAGIRWYDALLAVRSGWRYSAGVIGRSLVGLAVTAALGLLIWFTAPRLFRVVRMRRRVERVRRGQASVGDATLLYERMLHVLKRQGYEKPVWFTPVEFAATLPSSPMASAVQDFTAAYNALRFGGRTDAAARLSVLLDELEHRP